MKSFQDKVTIVLYCGICTGLAFVIYVLLAGGFRFVFLGEAESFWKGPFGLLISLGVGVFLGWTCFKFQHREFGPDLSDFQDSRGDAFLFTKRLMVIAGAVAALWFIIDLARKGL